MLLTTRLVSLLSFGGVGKTRLAIEVAANLADRFVDGVWFVDLVPITEAILLPDTFIAGVGLPATGNRDPEAYLVSQLATRNALIVVDNCEHLVDDVGDLVGRLVRAAPDVRVLTTSRLSLGVRDEVIWHVQPLAIATAAFELFSQRARLVRPGFQVDDSNRGVIEQICERLDGIPLAIELASARLKTMTVNQVADHLEDRFRLLTRADRNADGRQQSLLATMTWSYDLLDDADSELLRRLSVFTDGFTLEAATVIGSDGAPSTIDVLDSLDRLVDASLITFVEVGGAARYRMLETVRDFAAGQLDQARSRPSRPQPRHLLLVDRRPHRRVEIRRSRDIGKTRRPRARQPPCRHHLGIRQRPPPTRHVDRHTPVDVLLGTGGRK